MPPARGRMRSRATGTSADPAVLDHFGERIRRRKYGYPLSRETYAVINKKPSIYFSREDMSPNQWEALSSIYEDDDHRILSDEFCVKNRARALKNFDLNRAFFSQVPQAAFEAALSTMLERNPNLKPVNDLRKWGRVMGLYVMVLDDYKQCYIGQSTDIRGRIKGHWAGTKHFDRLLWGDVHESVISIEVLQQIPNPLSHLGDRHSPGKSFQAKRQHFQNPVELLIGGPFRSIPWHEGPPRDTFGKCPHKRTNGLGTRYCGTFRT
ncbi:GIY-YIG nuclease family protein [Leifsonia sp. NPDC056665]|uniref:GIY-YIG nuclease family protein n=1 Tax=Leifsonia sp. NPDC056665 TaxID=3345901 RepID=UPI0036ACAA2C